MKTIVGIDGCPEGWICIFEEIPSNRIGSKIFPNIEQLIAAAPEAAVIAIDIPIGLTESGSRLCDVAARKLLGGKRASSVFPAPIRPALGASTYSEACSASMAAQGKKISKQAWMIYPKIRELDRLLQDQRELRVRIYEVHPEVCFAAWNGAPIIDGKKTPAGSHRRRTLVDAKWGGSAFDTIRTRYRRGEAADDDILDAFAALWTAERIVRGESARLPLQPATDSTGLPMQIVY